MACRAGPFIDAAQLALRDVDAGMVAEGEQGFGQLLMGRIVVGLFALRLEGGALRQAQVVHQARGIDPVVAWQAIVEALEQLPAGGLVLFGQGDGDFGPERALGRAAPGAGILLPEEGALGAVFGAVLQPADGGFGGSIGIAPMPAAVEAQQFAQGVEAGVTRALGQQQAGPGDASRFVQAFLGQPALARCV